MLTTLTIENFKGFGESFTLPLRPITLLFGPNSAGKSSILQAVHYAREVLDRHNLDAEDTHAGGPFARLGGFVRFVHGHDTSRCVRLGGSFSINWWRELPRYDHLDTPGPDVLEQLPHPRTAEVDFCVSWGNGQPYVSCYAVTVDSVPLATLQAMKESGGHCALDLNFDHPLLRAIEPRIYQLEEQLDAQPGVGVKNFGGQWTGRPSNQWNLLKAHEAKLTCDTPVDALPDLEHGLTLYFDGETGDTFPVGYRLLDRVLSRLIAGPGYLLRKHLAEVQYLGPLRDLPDGSYQPPTWLDPARWVGGLGAWDVLHQSSPAFVEQVSQWMADPERLDTGYEVLLRRRYQLDAGSDLAKRLLSGEAARRPEDLAREILDLPIQRRVVLRRCGTPLDLQLHELGVGISQVMPIVVGCLGDGPLFCIEQPELHLHPRMQCALGDLLIAGALGQAHRAPADENPEPSDEEQEALAMPPPAPCRRTMLAETHSEHLILRILRRIRETTRGTPRAGIPVTPEDLTVCYVGHHEGASRPQLIPVDENGEFTVPWPDQFFEQDFYERFF